MNIYYTYIYTDPSTNLPFYVGMGKNDRHLSHLNEAVKNPNPTKGEHKLNTIRKILKSGNNPIIQIIDKNLSREESIELEIFLIEIIGRKDQYKGSLTNLTRGGDGNVDWTPALREKMSKLRCNFVSAKNPITGERIRVRNDDIRWTSGELVGQNHGEVNSNKNGKLSGYIQAKNPITGECVRVKYDDIRWTSGELVGIRKGIPAHPNTIAAARSKKGIPKTAEHNHKVSESLKKLKWYYSFETDTVGRYKENEQPNGFIRVSGPHKRTPI